MLETKLENQEQEFKAQSEIAELKVKGLGEKNWHY
jgi:hypothetical protein